MAVIQDHVDVQAVLETAQAAAKGFGLQLFLVDDEQIPIDRRFIYTDRESYDELDSSSVPYEYAQVFFSQKRVPDELMIGRVALAATKVFFLCGPAYETDFSVWEAIADGSFEVDDGTNQDVITGVDFTGITAFGQVLTKLNAKLAALVAPNITGLENAEFKLDFLGRLILEMQTTGASAPTIQIDSDATGTDLNPLFDGDNGTEVAGVDAETPVDAVTAISQIDDSWYNLNLRGESSAEAVALASYIESKEKLLDLVVFDTTAKNPAVTTDVGYQLTQLNTKRTMVYYTEKTAEYPDAAVSGTVLPTEEGSTNWAHEQLALVTDSGLVKPLTVSERTALADKRYVWIEQIAGLTIMYDGITAGNEEKRVMRGRDWFVARIREALFSSMVNLPLHAFDNPTMSIVENIVRSVGAEGIDRAVIVDTPDRPFTVTIPDADTFTAAQRATHKAEIFSAFVCYINSAINDYKLVGTWTL